MRRSAFLLVLAVATVCAGVAGAQPTDDCTACRAGAQCEPRRQSCVAECRAQFFTVDPRRSDCSENCAKQADRCGQTADTACRARNACR